MSAKLKSFLWRLIYAVILILILGFMIPLLFDALNLSIPGGPAITLLKFAFACLILLFVIFGPTAPEPF